MKRRIYIWMILFTGVSLVACKKNDLWNQSAEVDRGRIVGQLINTEDNNPLKGVKVLFQRQTRANGTQTFIDTVSTDSEGRFSYEITYPNKVQVVIRDTGRYAADTVQVVLEEKKDYTIGLKSHPRFGLSAITTTLTDKDTKAPYANYKVVLFVKESATESYSAADTLVTDINGRVQFKDIAFPVYYKVKSVANENLYTLDSLEGRIVTKDPLNLNLANAKRALNYYFNSKNFYSLKADQDARIRIQLKKANGNYEDAKDYSFDSEGTVVIQFNAEYLGGAARVVAVNPSEYPLFGEKIFPITENTINNHTELEFKNATPKYATPVYTNLEVSELNTGSVTFGFPQDAVFDPVSGNTYITDGAVTSGNKIVKIDRFGTASVLIGSGGAGYVDGSLADAKTNGAWGVVVDNKGDLYFTDNNATGGNRIRKITFDASGNGTVSTIAGQASTGNADGIGAAASFNRPSGLAIDKNNNILYVSEWIGNRIRRIDLSTNRVELLAGSATAQSGDVEGIGSVARFNQLGNALELSPDGKKLFVSGNSSRFGVIDIPTKSYKFYTTNAVGSGYRSRGMDIAPNGDLFIYSPSTFRLYKTDVNQPVGTAVLKEIAGTVSGRVNGPAASASFNGVLGIMFNPYTNTWYLMEGDASGTKVRVIKSKDVQ
ncbi:NHL repeat protein [Sphingobacterium spiritivorum ATCC 33300]|uniref:NHL repeat protein n=1 Tax=Sphingobacterium spiritivorum ATCC 33300 TaxID=525372 RepID=C2G4C3_SPHSI|nr:hypothetical protein [Sphingobacterium spiritivorum]EEI90041.1 NHL repeat protein [Sphingobacterium spiritivorum ATCC 33300]QQS94940.1 hypothetical protein I6J03_16380 [Sphingobacterium spiritivorum]